MENIIFEDPSRRIVHEKKRVKSSSPLKKDISDLRKFHEQCSTRPYPPRDQLEAGESGSMTSLSAFSSYCDCLHLVLTAPQLLEREPIVILMAMGIVVAMNLKIAKLMLVVLYLYMASSR